MNGTEVELQYFRNDVKRFVGTDINIDFIKEIGSKYKTNMKIKEKSPSGYSQVIINITAEDEAALKECVREILRLYGKPDLPMSLFGGGSKKKGNELVKSVMKELGI